jgi:ligand-binding sensor domain-containing protein
MVIDNYNTKWCILDNTEPSTPRGLFYYNESINSARLIDPASLGSNVTGVNGIILEKNGEVWIATNNGVVIIQDPYQVVANPGSMPNMAKMRIIENGLSTPLLENVYSLAVDALNNKWIGTFSNGVIYVSPDGSTLLKRFNTLTSPIADDKIMSIATDPGTGIAYFGTNRGISSYSTIAVQPLENCDQIKVGPSPFLIPNTSLLKIDGLVAESTVKILTISGSLVYEFKTEGGRIANWDGRDFNGNLVSSGIYIVAGYNKDATKVCTGKVAVVRK